ncbi:MAG: hypothetical protein H6745_21255 [Deltaproteobacteria bacterium]|nr:hypothetical protein [Deltaproteobacteria bacterium]
MSAAGRPLGLLLVAVLAAVGAGAAPPDPAPPPHEPAPAFVRGGIVNYFPAGSRTYVIVNKGARAGLRVGQVGYAAVGLCELVEVYPFRSKGLLRVDDQTAMRKQQHTVLFDLAPPGPGRVLDALVAARVAEEPGASVLLRVGFTDGVRPGDAAELPSGRCRAEIVDDTTTWCAGDSRLEATGTARVTVRAAAGHHTPFPIPWHTRDTPTIPVDDALPEPGVRAPARHVDVVRVRGVGLRASRECLGFDADAAYFVLRAEPSETPSIPEATLVVTRVPFRGGPVATLATLEPAQPEAAMARLDTLRAERRLLACHRASSAMTAVPAGGGAAGTDNGQVWSADHGDGRVVTIWVEQDTTIWARAGAGATPRQVGALPVADGEPATLRRVLYVPGEPWHVAETSEGPVPFLVVLDE